jgi:predicted small lipoprotein YifL
MTLVKRSIVALALILSIAACGQSGPLYIPGNPSSVQPPQEPAAAGEEDDEPADNR